MLTNEDIQQIIAAVQIALKPQFESIGKQLKGLRRDLNAFRKEANGRFDRLETTNFETDQRLQVLEHTTDLPTPRFAKYPAKMFRNPKQITESDWPPII